MQIRLAGRDVPLSAEIEATQGDEPDDRRVRERRAETENDRLLDRALNRHDKRGHHGLRMSRFEAVQRAQHDGAGNEQPKVAGALLEQRRHIVHAGIFI